MVILEVFEWYSPTYDGILYAGPDVILDYVAKISQHLPFERYRSRMRWVADNVKTFEERGLAM